MRRPLFIIAMMVLNIAFALQIPPDSAAQSKKQTATENKGKSGFEALVGRWLRPDGGYIIQIRSVDGSGKMEAGYFNPRPINVSKAQASEESGKLKVFVELSDVGYPGSTYTFSVVIQPHVHAGDVLGDSQLTCSDLAGPTPAFEPHVRIGEREAQVRQRAVIGGRGDQEVRVCKSRVTLRGPGSVPPEPGRFGCGAGSADWAIAGVDIKMPPAVVAASMSRRVMGAKIVSPL